MKVRVVIKGFSEDEETEMVILGTMASEEEVKRLPLKVHSIYVPKTLVASVEEIPEAVALDDLKGGALPTFTAEEEEGEADFNIENIRFAS